MPTSVDEAEDEDLTLNIYALGDVMVKRVKKHANESVLGRHEYGPSESLSVPTGAMRGFVMVRTLPPVQTLRQYAKVPP